MQQKCFRQGELIFIPVSGLTKEQRAFLIAGGKNIGNCIREGEKSGHIHATNTGTLVELRQARGNFWVDGKAFTLPAGEMFVTAENQLKITHPEHETLALDKGDYVIRVQREYSELNDRQVLD